MAPILLDTTVLIDVLRGRPAAERLRRLRELGDEPYASAISVEELARGMRRGEESATLAVIAGLRPAPLGPDEGWLAGTWRREFTARGVTLTQADCLIAASAHAVGGRIATGNPRDFPMPELTVEHWPVGA